MSERVIRLACGLHVECRLRVWRGLAWVAVFWMVVATVGSLGLYASVANACAARVMVHLSLVREELAGIRTEFGAGKVPACERESAVARRDGT